MVATGFMILMILMFFTSFILIIPSIIGLIVCKKYKKRKGKKAKLIIRIALIIVLLIGFIMVSIPTAFYSVLKYENYKQAKYELTLEAASDRGDLSRVKQLLNSGINPDQNNGNNYTALMYACTGSGKYDIAELLIQYKCAIDVEFKGYSDGKEKGYTPLMYAVSEKENYKLVNLLIVNKANVNHKAVSDGKTPLIIAVDYMNYNVVDLLIKNGANVNATDNKGKTVLEYACEHSSEDESYELINTLLEHGALINTKTTNLEKLLAIVNRNIASYGKNENNNKTEDVLKEYGSK